MSQAPQRTVFVVDDDEAVRDSLGMLLRSVRVPGPRCTPDCPPDDDVPHAK